MLEQPRRPTRARPLFLALLLTACATPQPVEVSTPEPSDVHPEPLVGIQQVPVDTTGFDFRYTGETFSFPEGFPYGVGSGTALLSVSQSGAGHRVRFLSIPDRGPNEDYFLVVKDKGVAVPTKLFLPVETDGTRGFHLSIATLDAAIDASGVVQSVKVQSKLTLKDEKGEPLTGFPPPLGAPGQTGEVSLGDNLEVMEGKAGYDPEFVSPLPAGFVFGDVTFAKGGYAVGEEYGPHILLFDDTGTLMNTLSPGNGLPDALRFRSPNRGIEGGTLGPRGIWSINQSNLNLEGETKDTAPFVPMVVVDPQTQEPSTYMYPIGLGAAAVARYPAASALKIGDLTRIGDGRFLAIEQGSTPTGGMQNWLVLVSLEEATPVPEGLETLTPAQILSRDLRPAKIARFIDLAQQIRRHTGSAYEKYEGLFVAEVGTRTFVVVSTDPDFGLAGRVEGGPSPEPGDYTRTKDGTIIENLTGKPAQVTYVLEPTGERPQSFWLEVTGLDEWFDFPPYGWDDPWGDWPLAEEDNP